MTTFLAVVLLDVDYGLVAGLTMSILFMISWGFFPKIEIIQKTQFEDLFLIGDCFGVVRSLLISCLTNFSTFTAKKIH